MADHKLQPRQLDRIRDKAHEILDPDLMATIRHIDWLQATLDAAVGFIEGIQHELHEQNRLIERKVDGLRDDSLRLEILSARRGPWRPGNQARKGAP